MRPAYCRPFFCAGALAAEAASPVFQETAEGSRSWFHLRAARVRQPPL